MVWCGGGALWWVGKPFIVFSLAEAEQKYRFNDLVLRQGFKTKVKKWNFPLRV